MFWPAGRGAGETSGKGTALLWGGRGRDRATWGASATSSRTRPRRTVSRPRKRRESAAARIVVLLMMGSTNSRRESFCNASRRKGGDGIRVLKRVFSQIRWLVSFSDPQIGEEVGTSRVLISSGTHPSRFSQSTASPCPPALLSLLSSSAPPPPLPLCPHARRPSARAPHRACACRRTR